MHYIQVHKNVLPDIHHKLNGFNCESLHRAACAHAIVGRGPRCDNIVCDAMYEFSVVVLMSKYRKDERSIRNKRKVGGHFIHSCTDRRALYVPTKESTNSNSAGLGAALYFT